VSFALVAAVTAVVLAFTYAGITYVYRDAPRRGMDAGQWSGIVAVTLGTALFVYLAVRDPVGGSDDPGSTVDPE